MRHVGEYEDQKIILLGYNPTEERVLFVRPEAFSGADQNWLSEIIESGYSQQQKFLVRSLQREEHPSGENAFAFVMKNGRPMRIPPQDVKMYDKQQSIEWFGEPSNFILEHERRAGRTGNKKSTAATSKPEPVFQTPTKAKKNQQPIIEGIEPALPVPSVDAPVDIPPIMPSPAGGLSTPPLVTFASPTPAVTQTQPSPTVTSQDSIDLFTKTVENLKAVTDRLEKLTALETRVRSLEKMLREKTDKKAAIKNEE